MSPAEIEQARIEAIAEALRAQGVSVYEPQLIADAEVARVAEDSVARPIGWEHDCPDCALLPSPGFMCGHPRHEHDNCPPCLTCGGSGTLVTANTGWRIEAAYDNHEYVIVRGGSIGDDE